MSEKNFVAYGDAESILTGYANRIKQSPTTFVGTQAQWDALSSSQKAEYKLVDITDDEFSLNNLVDWESYEELGAKNLLSNDASSQVINGVTFIVNADGTVTVSGTATAQAEITLCNPIRLDSTQKYIMSAIPDGVNGNDYVAYISYSNTVDRNYIVWDGEVSFYGFDLVTYPNPIVSIGVMSGKTVDFTFRPMIRLASINDNTYVPYSMTNRQLTSKISRIVNPKNITVTAGTGITINEYVCRKIGSFVYLTLNMTATSNISAESVIATPSETINTTGYSNFCSDTIDPTRRIDVTLYNTIVTKSAIPSGAKIRFSTICLCEN